MSSGRGYDDQFNDGLFRATLNKDKVVTPYKWPKSVSAMRGHTDYTSQGMSNPNSDVRHVDYRIPAKGQASPTLVGCAPGPYGTCQPGRDPHRVPGWIWREGQK